MTPRILALFVTLALAVALAAPVEPARAGEPDHAHLEHSITSRILPKRRVHPRPTQAAPALIPPNAHLSFYGGPVLADVQIVELLWNDAVYDGDQFADFYATISQSAYLDWLAEYDTPTQAIGRGTLVTAVTDPSPPSQTLLSSDAVESELSRLIDDGTLPAPTPSTVYMVHFPPRVTITLGGTQSCEVFCAFHGAFVRDGQLVIYAVIPDHSTGACGDGTCGIDGPFGSACATASSELIDLITDPEGGLGETSPPVAWFDYDVYAEVLNEEIGDICSDPQVPTGRVGDYVVQTEWSNLEGNCITTRDPAVDDFTISTFPPTATILPGERATLTITTSIFSGAPGDIDLTLFGLPNGVTGSFDRASVVPGQSTTLTLLTAAGAPSDHRTVTLIGSASGASHTAPFTLSIGPTLSTPDARLPPDALPPADAHPAADATPHATSHGGCDITMRSSPRASAPACLLSLLSVLGMCGAVMRRRLPSSHERA